MTVVDTTVWVDFFGGRDTPQVAKLEELVEDGETIGLCGVILTEVLQGIRDDTEFARTELVLRDLDILPMTQTTFLLAAEIYRKLRQRGITIRNSVDCMIAAACLDHQACLLHHDRDFDPIAQHFGVQVVACAGT